MIWIAPMKMDSKKCDLELNCEIQAVRHSTLVNPNAASGIQLFRSKLHEKGHAGFGMVIDTKISHSFAVKTIEDVCKYDANAAEEKAIKMGTETKSNEFVEKGAKVYAEA